LEKLKSEIAIYKSAESICFVDLGITTANRDVVRGRDPAATFFGSACCRVIDGTLQQ